MIRNPHLLRAIATTLLVEMSAQMLWPLTANALTGGANQPEFTSYEAPGTTDMVNLSTGDFTYSLPLLEIPGPDGGFSLPISYHSGIGLEDEATWAGLGWNINPGAISRAKVGSPDDDKDVSTTVHVQDPGGRGFVKNYLVYQRTWDSNRGYGGAINIWDVYGFSWERGNFKDFTALGLTFNKDKVTFNEQQAFNGIMTLATLGAGGPAASVGTKIGYSKATAILSAGSTAMSIGMTAQGLYSGYKSMGTFGGSVGSMQYERKSSHLGFRQDYRYWLDATRTEHSYGALYLGQMQNVAYNVPPITFNPTAFPHPAIQTPQGKSPVTTFPTTPSNAAGNEALVSDMYTHLEPNTPYAWSFNPTHIAYDSYSVMGPGGVSGSISPYRKDIGSLIYPKEMSNSSSRFNLVPFVDENTASGKVQFKYEGDLSNAYRHHNSNGPGFSATYTDPPKQVVYDVQDTKLTDAANRIEADRNGLYNSRLAQGRHVEWFTNEELRLGGPQQAGSVMDDALARTYRHNLYEEWPAAGIGAFAVTAADGTTYHYALPVYNKYQADFTGVTNEITTKYSTSQRPGKYATTWLLTAITGSDFVDRGTIGEVDGADTGYWIKFEYGRFASDYTWRFPYIGYTQADGHSSYSVGIRESYYLDAVKTRSHTALFLKDVRRDGRSAYSSISSGGYPPGMSGMDGVQLVQNYPTSSLRLREAVLLTNSDFEQVKQMGFRKDSYASQIADRDSLNAYIQHISKLREVFDLTDVNPSSAIRNFIDAHAIRKVALNTSYTLCDGTPNSFASAVNPPFIDQPTTAANRGGKLTLNSISYFGPNNQRVVPDIKFEYNSPNPSYHKDAWDGWGFYNSSSVSSGLHTVTNLSDPAAWHLTDIISSLGGRITVAYESDDYASISGEPIRQSVPITWMHDQGNNEGRLEFDIRNITPYSLLDLLTNGSAITLHDVEAVQIADCWDGRGRNYTDEDPYSIPTNQTVRGLTANSFVVDRSPFQDGWGWISGCDDSRLHSIKGRMEVVMPEKTGGGVRVASITSSTGTGETYTTGYRYTKDGTPTGVSSGCVAQEPEMVRTTHYPFYDWYDYPNTPVLYDKVTVVNGVRSATDFVSKTEYSFRMPESSDMTVSGTMPSFNNLNWPHNTSHIGTSKLFNFDVHNFASRVGRLESIRLIDRSGVTVGQTAMEYSNRLPGNLGTFTGGSILCELVQEGDPTSNHHFKASRTTKTAYPNVLTAVHTTTNGVTNTRTNRAWDFLTGAVTATETTNSWGESYRSQTEPAYEKYPAMRSKAENPANRHMLTQPAGSTTYKLDAAGNPSQLVAASAQTWSSQWPQRTYNAATDQYGNTAAAAPRWRQQAGYEWLNRRLNANGLTPLADYTAFSWLNPTPPANWVQVGQTTLYDPYSAPLEAHSVSGTKSASKLGYGQTLPLIGAENAGYGEIAASGAEDVVEVAPGVRHFGGEVRGGEYQSADKAHTGAFSLKLAAGQQGFVYQAQVGVTGGVEAGREYKAGVWLHESDLAAAGGRLYARLGAGGTTTTLGTIDIRHRSVKRAGEWRLLDLYFTVPAGTSTGHTLRVGCENVGAGTTYFDDFRFHPVDAPVSTTVYNPHTWEHTHALNSDNLYTRFEYDAVGRLRKTHREVLGEAVPDRVVSGTVVNYARNATFTIGASVANPAHGSLTGSGAASVLLGEDVTFAATGVDCSWVPSGQFTVDGTAYANSVTLADGTRIQFNSGNRTYRVTNVRGNHTLRVSFAHVNHLPAGTVEEIGCEWDGQCRTGYMRLHDADGCGGFGPEYTRWAPADCPWRTSGCP